MYRGLSSIARRSSCSATDHSQSYSQAISPMEVCASASRSSSESAGDVVLNGEDVVQLPVVALRPDLVAVPDVHEPRAHTNTAARRPHAPLEHVGDPELR